MSRDETAGLRAAQLRLGRLPGYVRRPDPARRSGAQGHTYKKGWEVRFTARSEAEIAEIRDLVVAAGFAPARPFFKGHQLIQPVYGMAAVQAYLAARQAAEEQAARTAPGRIRGTSGAAALRTATRAAHAAAEDTARELRELREDPGREAAEHAAPGFATRDRAAPDRTTPDLRGREHERERPTVAEEVARTAGAAAAAAARRSRRRAAEAFPAQLARGTAPDDLTVPTKTRNTN
ncbi:hypothetical protein [Kitasatospora purpeofusca]|uniref:hypothetical protein n=1 Tax=Kitasatospora purpeofusca TaxID=67352 RepID=UPI002A59B05A|nr:hypothetical protein [Kitasatospora purpeofusca]MDY0810248.1 hypothetical protein [Kitasatospora purpeofusca]